MMFAILPKISLLVFLSLACQYDNGLSSCSEELRKNSVAKTSQQRTSRLLVAEIDEKLKSVSDSKSSLTKNKKGSPENQSDVETVYNESLSSDMKIEILLQGRPDLSYVEDKKILEEIANKAILKYLAQRKRTKELEDQINNLKQKVMNYKMINIAEHQKALKEVRDSIKTKYNDVVVPTVLEGMKRMRETNANIPNPVGMLDSKIEKKLFDTYSYMDEREHDPNVSKKQFKILKIKKYGAIMALPFVVILPALGLYGGDDFCHYFIFLFAAVSFLISFYILVKILKYDLKSNGVKKPRFKDYVESFKRCIKGVAP
ncbi:Plasmodium exported protein, unknown function [Plasmodium vivax]|uniref:Pv-fam-b protein n=1 Tax=Plasmodium vivax TaxID=5855 RepID=A0A1G4H7W5_PLAVI|nr:Plasmodium exported protein, unknown function [Plasmodium vivax]